MQQLAKEQDTETIYWCGNCGTLRLGLIRNTPRNSITCPDHEWKNLARVPKVGNIPKTNGKTNEDSLSNGFGPPCIHCHGMTRRAGSCYYCQDCGNSSGCS